MGDTFIKSTRRAGGIVAAMGILCGICAQARGDSLLEWARKFVDRATAPEATPTPAPSHITGLPLPSGANAPTEKDFRRVYAAWLNRTIMAHYPADNDKAGAEYVRFTLNYLSEHSTASPPSPETVAWERSFDLQSVTDPALLLMIGIIEPPSERHRAALQAATNLFPSSSYPKFIWFMAAANMAKASHGNDAPAEQLKSEDELSLKYLEGGLNDDSFLPDEMSALRWRFNSPSFKDLFSRNEQRVADIFESSAKAPMWVKNYVEGVKFVSEAWEARGDDWANNVRPEGWKGFAGNLALARARLVNSWSQNPHDAAAAGEMIKVCMGESEETETMRKWFDRSVAADFDYIDAYINLKWGLRPRWLGSYAEMNAFGQECAATARYDTAVPYERVAIAEDISDDAEDHGAQFQNPEVANQVLGILNTYLAERNPPISVDYAHTLAAIVAHKVGRMDEMRRHLAAINYKPVPARSLMQMDNLRSLASQAEGAGTP